MLPTFMRNQFRSMITRDFLNDTCMIEVQAQIQDEIGASRPVWNAVASSVPCRVIDEARGSTTVVASRETMTENYRLIIPAKDGTYSFDLAVNQRVTTSDARVFQVTAIQDGRTDAVDRQATIKRLR